MYHQLNDLKDCLHQQVRLECSSGGFHLSMPPKSRDVYLCWKEKTLNTGVG